MRGWWWVPLLVATRLAAGTDGIVAEGGWWKQVSGFQAASEGVTRLHIVTRGQVRVRGERGLNRITGTLTKRVKAPSATAAKSRFDPVAVVVQNQGSVVMLEVSGQWLDSPELILEITIPKSTRQTAIQTRWGDVEATDLDGAVFVESGGGAVRLDGIGQDAIARTAGGEMRLGRIGGSLNGATGGGTIRVDTIGGRAEFATGGGEIWVREVRGTLHASTAGGSIHVEKAGGEVVANSGGGLIEVARAGGPVSATTTGGSIEVGAGQNVQCESGQGTIRLKGVSGTVRATTADGMILAEIPAGAQLNHSFLSATKGDIIVYLPSNLAVTVRARTEPNGTSAGRIVSEFEAVQGRRDRYRYVMAEGRLNGGGPVLELAAVGGTIHLRRLK